MPCRVIREGMGAPVERLADNCVKLQKKSWERWCSAIPAKAGIQYWWIAGEGLDSVFHRRDDFTREYHK